jgi:hypothetical protein
VLLVTGILAPMGGDVTRDFGFRNQPPLPRRLVPHAFAGVCPPAKPLTEVL